MRIKNIITVTENGPLQLEGDFRVYDTAGRRRDYHQGKIKLCRCGASKRKPLCDGSHLEVGFKDCCVVDNSKNEELQEETTLIISSRPNGMLVAKGPMRIIGSDGKTGTMRNKAALCRCGESRNKPFCDISHKKCGFVDAVVLTEISEEEDLGIIEQASQDDEGESSAGQNTE